MTTTQPTFLTEDDLRGELSTARIEVDRALAAVRDFSVVHHEQPWVSLEDLLSNLRAAATTVAVLEGIQARAG